MTVLEVQNEIKNMSSDDQDRLAGFLAALRKFRDPEYRKELEERKKDSDPNSWISLDEMKRKLGRAL